MLLATLGCLAFGSAPASAAVLTVHLDGAATGTVTSDPPGIDCSNTGGGAAGPDCSFNFTPVLSTVQLTATADAPGIFTGWTGNAFTGSTCNTGSTNPCSYQVVAPVSITASFGPPPDPPVTATKPASLVGPYSAKINGTVNPGGFAVNKCVFEYGRSTSYGTSVVCQPGDLGTGTSDVAVAAFPQRLDPGTTYHYRLVTEGVGGTSTTDDRTFTTSSVPADSCPNAAVRAQQRVGLPDCMALEMVSPPEKASTGAFYPSFGSGGDRVRFRSRGALGDTPGLAIPLGDWYVAQREATDWTTYSVAPPAAYGRSDSQVPLVQSADYQQWFSIVSNEDQYGMGYMSQFDGWLGKGQQQRLPDLVPLGNNRLQDTFQKSKASQGASADMTHDFFQPGQISGFPETTVYLPGDPVPTHNVGVSNTYVSTRDAAGHASLSLLARAGDGTVVGGTCGTVVGGGSQSVNAQGMSFGKSTGTLKQGAISPDGKRVFFSARPTQSANASCDPPANPVRIMKRVEAPGGVQISSLISSECTRTAPACDTTDGDDLFQAASADGTKVFFVTNRQLANTDTDTGPSCRNTFTPALASAAGCDLYLYDATLPAGHRLIQVSAGDSTDATPGAGAKVLSSIPGVSTDGSHAYFVAQGVLTTTPNSEGNTAVAGKANLYVYERDAAHPSGRTAFIGTLADTDGDVFGQETTLFLNNVQLAPFFAKDAHGKQVGADGHIIAFQSNAELTADDTDGDQTDVYRYDADSGVLQRISKAGPDGTDNGPYSVDRVRNTLQPGPDYADAARYMSDDGHSIVFASQDGLVDGNENPDFTVFLWHDGTLSAMPGDATRSHFFTGARQNDTFAISRSGKEVAFGTSEALLPQDGDTARDVYVARVDGGTLYRLSTSGCDPLAEVGCQGPLLPGEPGAPSPLPLAGSTSFTGPGNVIGSPAKMAKAPKRKTPKPQVKRPKTVRGTQARLRVKVSVAGRLRTSGSGLRRSYKTAKKSGTVSVRVRLSRRARRTLHRKHRVRVRVRVRFTPKHGRARSVRVKMTFKSPTAKKRGNR